MTVILTICGTICCILPCPVLALRLQADGWSAEHEFTAPPVAGPSPEPFKFLVFNDVCMGADVSWWVAGWR